MIVCFDICIRVIRLGHSDSKLSLIVECSLGDNEDHSSSLLSSSDVSSILVRLIPNILVIQQDPSRNSLHPKLQDVAFLCCSVYHTVQRKSFLGVTCCIPVDKLMFGCIRQVEATHDDSVCKRTLHQDVDHPDLLLVRYQVQQDLPE